MSTLPKSSPDSNQFSIGASRLAKALNRLIETPPAVDGVHEEPCEDCPSAHHPPDPEVQDSFILPLGERLSMVFPCGWRPERLCRGHYDLMQNPPAVETETESEESVVLKAHLEAHDDYLDHCSGVNEPGDGSGE